MSEQKEETKDNAVIWWKFSGRWNCLLVANRSEAFEDDPGAGCTVTLFWRQGSAGWGGMDFQEVDDMEYSRSMAEWVDAARYEMDDWVWDKPMPEIGGLDFATDERVLAECGFEMRRDKFADIDDPDRYVIEHTGESAKEGFVQAPEAKAVAS